MLEKLASSFESLDELRWCFFRRKKLRLADVEPRLASASKSPKLRRKSNSSSTLWEKYHQLYYYTVANIIIIVIGIITMIYIAAVR